MDIDKPGHTISPLLWGIFFEDINLSADGGLYPELVRNRSFEGSDELRYWKFTSSSANSTWAVDASRPLNPFNRHCLRVKAEGGGTLENEGYWGMNFVAGNACTFTVAARSTDNFKGKLTVQICDASGAPLGSGEISDIGSDWKYHSLTLTPSKSDPKGKLKLAIGGTGTLFLDMISLTPATGPSIGPIKPGMATKLIARISSDLGNVRTSVNRPTGTIIAPPNPCRTRQATSRWMLFETPQSNEPSVNVPIAQTAPGGNLPVNGVCIFDNSNGSLRLTERLAANFSAIISTALTAEKNHGNADLVDALEGLLVELNRVATVTCADASAGVLNDTTTNSPEGWQRVIAPGSKAIMTSTSGTQEVTVLAHVYTPSGLQYQLQHPSPTVRWMIAADGLELINGVTATQLYNVLTGEIKAST